MSTRQKTAVSAILILVPAYLDETQLIHCLEQWQRQGLKVILIPLRPAASHQQATFVSLSEAKARLATLAAPHLFWVAGGFEAVAVALADPRTHEIAQHILQAGGFVAACPEAYGLLCETGLWRSVWAERFLWWQEETAVCELICKKTS